MEATLGDTAPSYKLDKKQAGEFESGKETLKHDPPTTGRQVMTAAQRTIYNALKRLISHVEFAYGYYTVRGLEPGKVMKWCTCGLSKKQPWCDSAHKGTGFKSYKWKVPEKPQTMYSICGCKHTKHPPFCDGTHVNLPMEMEARQKACSEREQHPDCCKMCTSCGWVPDF